MPFSLLKIWSFLFFGALLLTKLSAQDRTLRILYLYPEDTIIEAETGAENPSSIFINPKNLAEPFATLTQKHSESTGTFFDLELASSAGEGKAHLRITGFGPSGEKKEVIEGSKINGKLWRFDSPGIDTKEVAEGRAFESQSFSVTIDGEAKIALHFNTKVSRDRSSTKEVLAQGKLGKTSRKVLPSLLEREIRLSGGVKLEIFSGSHLGGSRYRIIQREEYWLPPEEQPRRVDKPSGDETCFVLVGKLG